MDNNDTATPPLFRSLLRALRGDIATDQAIAVHRVSVDESARSELEEWYGNGSLSGRDQDGYARFYGRLVGALREQQRHGVLSDVDDALVDEWLEADWPRDREVLSSPDPFIASLSIIASSWVDSDDNPEISALTTLSVVRKLRGLCGSDESGGQAAPAAVEKRPMTMAEKLAHMRSQRSALLSKEASTRGVSQPPAATTLTEDDSTPPSTATPVSNDSLRGGNDDSSHYFSIETRIELKERLAALQLRLDELLVQTKLAWMKCFAHSSGCDDETSLPGQDSDQTVAAQLVEQGEALAFHLLDAFEKARKATCPINDYKALVATCEAEFQSFQTLVSATAAAPSPVRSKPPLHEPSETQTSNQRARAPIVKPQPAAFDLPSMKAYYDRAAPSYTAYLPQKKR